MDAVRSVRVGLQSEVSVQGLVRVRLPEHESAVAGVVAEVRVSGAAGSVHDNIEIIAILRNLKLIQPRPALFLDSNQAVGRAGVLIPAQVLFCSFAIQSVNFEFVLSFHSLDASN